MLLDLGEEASPEVVNSTEEAIREAEQSEHPRKDCIAEVLAAAMKAGKPVINANYWGCDASRLPVVACDFRVCRVAPTRRIGRRWADDVLGDFEGNLIGDCWSGFLTIDVRSDP